MVKEQEPVHNTQMELDFPEFEEAIVNEEPVVNELPELVANEAPEHQVMRRSERDRRPPTYYGEWATTANDDGCELRTVNEALLKSEMRKSNENRNRIS